MAGKTLTKKQKKDRIRRVQRDLNFFTRDRSLGLPPLKVDGDKGHATRRRTKVVKRLLGYGRKNFRNAKWTPDFLWQLTHPHKAIKDEDWARKRVRRGLKRRNARRRDVARNSWKAVRTSGVTFYNGVPVAKWLVPYLNYARAHGWQGRLNSGFRDPAYSERLCFNMCGAPSCPGRCAGRSSGHSQASPPNGCVDVSDYAKFGQEMRDCPLQPRIFNALGARDPVHFSASGR